MNTLMICGKDDPIFKQLSRDWYIFTAFQNHLMDFKGLQKQIGQQANRCEYNNYWGTHTILSLHSELSHDYLLVHKELSKKLSYVIWSQYINDFFTYSKEVEHPIGYMLTEEHYYLILTNCLLGLPYLTGIELEDF